MSLQRIRDAVTSVLLVLSIAVPLRAQGPLSAGAFGRGATVVVEGRGPAAAPWNPALGMLWDGPANGVLLPSGAAEQSRGAGHDYDVAWFGVQSGGTLLLLHSRDQRSPAGQEERRLTYSQVSLSHAVSLGGAATGPMWAGAGLHLRHIHHDRVGWRDGEATRILEQANRQEIGLDLGLIARPTGWLLAGVSATNLVQIERAGEWRTSDLGTLPRDSAHALHVAAPQAVGRPAPGWLRAALSANSRLGLWSVGIAIPYTSPRHPEALDAARWSAVVGDVHGSWRPRFEYSVDGRGRRAIGAVLDVSSCSFRVVGGVRYRLDPTPTWGGVLSLSLGGCPDH